MLSRGVIRVHGVICGYIGVLYRGCTRVHRVICCDIGVIQEEWKKKMEATIYVGFWASEALGRCVLGLAFRASCFSLFL